MPNGFESFFDEHQLDIYRQRFGRFGAMIERLPSGYRRLRDGETLDIEIGNLGVELLRQRTSTLDDDVRAKALADRGTSEGDRHRHQLCGR